MIDYKDVEHLLETYTLQEIFELNDLTEADVLLFLLDEEFLEAPEIKPLDFDD